MYFCFAKMKNESKLILNNQCNEIYRYHIIILYFFSSSSIEYYMCVYFVDELNKWNEKNWEEKIQWK